MALKAYARNQFFIVGYKQTALVPNGSAVCNITINNASTPAYSLIDNNFQTNQNMSYAKFEIAKLVRDFIVINPPNYSNSTMYTPNFQNTSIEVDTSVQFFDAKNGQGNTVGSAQTKTIFFLDGYVEQRDLGNQNYNNDSVAQTNRLVQLPQDQTGIVPKFNQNGFSYETFSGNVEGWLNLTNSNSRIYIQRLCEDSKNATLYRQIVFINKFGAYQTLWFLKVSNQTQSGSGETYTGLPTDYRGRHNYNEHYYKDFNRNSRQSVSLLSPLVPEGFVDTFQELMLSEQVWFWNWNYLWEAYNPDGSIITGGDFRMFDPYTGQQEKRSLPQKKIFSYKKPQFLGLGNTKFRQQYELTPVNIKTGSIVTKRHATDKANIQYQIDIDFAFDDIYMTS